MKATDLFGMPMTPLYRALGFASLLALAACGTNDASNYSSHGPFLGAITPPADYGATSDTTVASAPPPSQAVAAGVENLDITGFTDPSGFALMGPGARSQAASAQYYALQFGRVGAARTWTGENNVTGQVSVGPYVKVNNRDCRDFTNVVNVGAKSYTKRGTACRELDGTWTVGGNGGPPALTPSASGVGAAG